MPQIAQHKFEDHITYVYGYLTKDSSLDHPKWGKSPWIRTGQQMKDLGVNSVEEYLLTNPEGLSTDRPIHFFARTGRGHGSDKYLAGANPSNQRREERGLGNPGVVVPQDPEDQPQRYGISEEVFMATNREAMAVLRDTNRMMMEENASLRAALNAASERFENMVDQLNREIAVERTEKEKAIAEKIHFEKLIAERDKYQEQVDGLADKFSKEESGTSMQDIFSAISALTPLIGMLKNSNPNPQSEHPGFNQAGPAAAQSPNDPGINFNGQQPGGGGVHFNPAGAGKRPTPIVEDEE